MNQERRSGTASVESNSTQGLLMPRIARIVGTTSSGTITVECGFGAQAARLMSGLKRSELAEQKMQGREVLVVFEAGDPEKPIILGLVQDPLDELIAFDGHSELTEEPKDIVLDGRRMTIEAHEEIVLKCGEGSITLRKDGKIIIKGTHLLSRATGPNRIKGGSVQIN